MVLTVSFALSLVTGLSCHHRQRNAQALSPLDISVGMSGPHDFAVHELALSSKHQSRPPHPVPTFMTIAKRPSVWHGTAIDMPVIWVNRERIYFCERDWTGQISLIWFKKLDFTRRPFCRRIARRMGGAKAISSYFVHESDGFREGLSPSSYG
jgi:hypothetical protein